MVCHSFFTHFVVDIVKHNGFIVATINATTAVPGNEGDAATSVNVPAIVAPVVVVLGAIIIILVVLLL